MPKATPIHTTPPPPNPCPFPVAAPVSIEALGRWMCELDNASCKEGPSTADDLEKAGGNAFHQAEALRDLLATMPPRTIADAGYLLHTAAVFASFLEANTFTDPNDAKELINKVESILVGVIPIVAEAAGIDMKVAGWDSYEHLRDRHRYIGLEAAQ